MIGFLVDSTFCLREIKRNIVGGTWLITFIHDWSDTQWKQGTNNFEHIKNNSQFLQATKKLT
jgi:hypothetical protein